MIFMMGGVYKICRWIAPGDMIYMLWYVCWKPEFGSQQIQQLLGNGSTNPSVARQLFRGSHVIAEADTQ
jgi:hypothetical protein